MELLLTYLTMLKDSATPEHRVVRKTAVLSVLSVVWLVYQRHFVLDLVTGETVLATLAMAFVLLIPANMIVGVLNAGFYRDFLRDAAATQSKQTITVFLAEWLFAGAVPIGCLLLGTFLL
jgi:hypothetical protein